MGQVKLTNVHKQRIALVAFVLTVLMLLNVVFQIRMHTTWRHWIPATLAMAPAASQPTDTQPAPAAAASKPGKPPPIHAAIRKRNIMTQPVPKGHGMKLTGVLGNIALFMTRDGKTVGIEEGKSEHGIKVTAVDGYSVTIEYEGKPETMKLFADEKGPAPMPATPELPVRDVGESAGSKTAPPSKPAEAAGEKAPSTQPRGATP
jgi:hypothetical protein